MDKLKLGALGERLKVGGAQMGRAVSGKMKEILQGPTQESKMVDEATSENLEEPNWGLNLRICAMLNSEEFSGTEILRSIKKKIGGKSVVSQRLGLDLLEACAMNCEKVFSEIASEKVLEEMVKMIENQQTDAGNRQRALELIRAWGQSEDLTYLPVFSQTYMSLKTKSITPLEDDGNAAFSFLDPNFDQQPLTPAENYPIPDASFGSIAHNTIAYHGGSQSVEEKKEFLVVTRNSVELLSTLLNDTEPKPVTDDLTLSMLEKCKESQPVIQRIIQSTTDDEAMLFEALNLNDELQQVISKYEKIQLKVQPPESRVEAVDEAKMIAPKSESGEMGKSKIAEGESDEKDAIGEGSRRKSPG